MDLWRTTVNSILNSQTSYELNVLLYGLTWSPVEYLQFKCLLCSSTYPCSILYGSCFKNERESSNNLSTYCQEHIYTREGRCLKRKEDEWTKDKWTSLLKWSAQDGQCGVQPEGRCIVTSVIEAVGGIDIHTPP